MTSRTAGFFGFIMTVIALLFAGGSGAIWYGFIVEGLLTLILGVLIAGLLVFNLLLSDYLQKSMKHQDKIARTLSEIQKNTQKLQ